MKFVIAIFRLVLIGLNLLLINFEPETEVEIRLFFASRLVFFLMLIIDYVNVAYYNKELERKIGIAGIIVAILCVIVDGMGFFNFLVLEIGKNGYTITGNPDNFLTSWIKPFPAIIYIFSSWVAVIGILGIEVFNHGKRAIPRQKSEELETKPA